MGSSGHRVDRLLSSSCRSQFIAAAQCMSTTGKGLKKDECMRLQNAVYACTREQKLSGGDAVVFSRAVPTHDLALLAVRCCRVCIDSGHMCLLCVCAFVSD